MEFVVIVEPDEVGRKRLESVFQTEKPSFSYKITESPEVAIGLLEQQHVDAFVIATRIVSGDIIFAMEKNSLPLITERCVSQTNTSTCCCSNNPIATSGLSVIL